jgi:hypothetical protein
MVRAVLDKYKIRMFSVYSTMKSSMVERAIGTIRRMTARVQTRTGSKNVIGILPTIIKNYNNTVHSATKFKPAAVTEEDQQAIWDNVYGKLAKQKPKPLQFKVGDLVRISAAKLIFDKATSTQGWTSEVFKVARAVQSTPVNYFYLTDLKGEKIEGGFYSEELQRIRQKAI